MEFDSFLADQASKPSGWFGLEMMGQIFNQANSRLEDMGLRIMKLQTDSKVLEIGFGNGRMLQLMGSKVTSGKIMGVEISPEMIAISLQKNKKWLDSKVMEILETTVGIIPVKDNSLDKIFTSNTIYYWPEPKTYIKEVLRSLKQGGKFYCAFRPCAEILNNHIVKNNRSTFKNLYSKEGITEFLNLAGFRDIKIHIEKDRPYSNMIAVGTK